MNKLLTSYILLFFVALVLPMNVLWGEDLAYAMATCNATVYRLNQMNKTYQGEGLKFKEVLDEGSDALLIKKRWTGVNVVNPAFIKVFTYRYTNSESMDIDVMVQSYCREISKSYLLNIFKKQRITYVPAFKAGCYLINTQNSVSPFLAYRYGAICLSAKNLIFAHLTPSFLEAQVEKRVEKITPEKEKEEKDKIAKELEELILFYLEQLETYKPKKLKMSILPE